MDVDFSGLLPKTLNELSDHFTTYVDLYIKPIQSYKKAFSQRKNSLNYVSLHAIYYTLLLLLLVFDIQLIIKVVLAEVVLTIIPVVYILLPFILFTKILKKNKNWFNLFRLLLIIKLQNAPIIVLLAVFAKKFEVNSAYILMDNWIIITMILDIITVPIIINNIKLWQRFVWILANYLSLIVSLIIFGIVFSNIDIPEKLTKKLSLVSPSNEYYQAMYADSLSMYNFRDDRYMAIIDKRTGFLRNTQFVTFDLNLILHTRALNQNVEQVIILDSLMTQQNPRRKRESHKYVKVKEDLDVNLRALDTLKSIFNAKVNYDKDRFKIQKDSLQFKMNRDFALLRYNYWVHMDSMYTDWDQVKKISRTNKIGYSVNLDSNKIAIVFNLDSIPAYKQKQIILDKKKEISNFLDRSSFLEDIFLYPLFTVFDFIDI